MTPEEEAKITRMLWDEVDLVYRKNTDRDEITASWLASATWAEIGFPKDADPVGGDMMKVMLSDVAHAWCLKKFGRHLEESGEGIN